MFLTVDDTELPADVSADMRLLDVVTRVDGLEKFIKEPIEVTLVEGPDGIAVLPVGLTLLKRLGYKCLIVVTVGKIHHFCPDKDVSLLERCLQRNTL